MTPRPDWHVWQRHGYTPTTLYGFYDDQITLLLEEFPGKDTCYPLIQGGFPRANAANPLNRPDATEQTTEIIRRGRERLGTTWIVQHLGLQPTPDAEFPGKGWHPIVCIPRRGDGPNRYKWVGWGFPNSWALDAGIADDERHRRQAARVGDRERLVPQRRHLGGGLLPRRREVAQGRIGPDRAIGADARRLEPAVLRVASEVLGRRHGRPAPPDPPPHAPGARHLSVRARHGPTSVGVVEVMQP